MTGIDVLEWIYKPANFIEEKITLKGVGYTIDIEQGKVRAEVESELFDKAPEIKVSLNEIANCQLLAVQVLTFKSYTLSGPSRIRHHLDGRQEFFLEIQSCTHAVHGHAPDLIYTDANGNVVDTRRIRRARTTRLADAIETFRSDQILSFILNCHSLSIKDQNNEFLYLYEIQQALAYHFHPYKAVKERHAIEKLNFNPNRWHRLTAICNNSTISQGRHRGERGGVTRPATEQELIEVRTIVQDMIIAYLDHLDNASTAPPRV